MSEWDLALAEPETQVSQVRLSPTVSQFVQSEADIVQLEGPRGEGKSVGGVAGMIYHAEHQGVRPVRWAAVRDTWVNLERTVLATLIEGHREGWWHIELRKGGEIVQINGDLIRLYCFGMDTIPDANKFQSFELGGLWVEEPAPAADLSSGVPFEVVALGFSSLRQKGVARRRVQLTHNPPDDEHWTAKLADLFAPPITIQSFLIPAGENQHLPTGYREKMRAALERTRPDLVGRFVEGRRTVPIVGEAVVPPFSRQMHVAKEPLPVYAGLEIFRFWDSGTPNLHPAVVFAQAKPPLWINILASRVGENVGILEFIREQVLPLQRAYGWLPPTAGTGFGKGSKGGFRFRDIGDPSCLIPEGTSSQRTVALEIQNALGTSFEPGPVAWSARREALLAAFERPGKGDRPRMVQIDPEENPVLIKALEGRFHYPRDSGTGRILGTVEAAKRVSGQYCVDYATEILTEQGWKTSDALRIGETVFGYDLNRDMLVRTPLKAVHQFQDAVVHVYRAGYSEIILTPDHQCVVRQTVGRARRPQITMRSANQLTCHSALLVAAPHEAIEESLPDWLVRICAWVGSEGSYRKKNWGITVSQSWKANPHYVASLDELFVGRAKRYEEDRGIVQWWLSRELALTVRALMPEKCPDKLALLLSGRQARLFLYEWIRGDGTWDGVEVIPEPSSDPSFAELGSSGPSIFTSSEQVGSSLQMIATLAGLRSKLCQRVGKRMRECQLRLSRGRVITPAYRWKHIVRSMPVWCPETDTSTWVARRKGLVFITGNSHPVDCLGYGFFVLFPPDEWMRAAPPPPVRPVQPPKSWLGV